MSVTIKGALIGAMIFGSSPVAMVREAASSHVPDRVWRRPNRLPALASSDRPPSVWSCGASR